MLSRKERAAKIKNLLMLFCDSIKNYEDQVKEAIDLDERSSEEFVDLFLDSEDAYDFVELTKYPALGEVCRAQKINHPMDPEEWDCDCWEAEQGEPCAIEGFKPCTQYPGCLFKKCPCGDEYDLKIKLGNKI